jgi:hypothetical protein
MFGGKSHAQREHRKRFAAKMRSRDAARAAAASLERNEDGAGELDLDLAPLDADDRFLDLDNRSGGERERD